MPLGAWTWTCPSGWHVVQLGRAPSEGRSAWLEEVDETLGQEEMTLFLDDLSARLASTVPFETPMALVACGACLAALVGDHEMFGPLKEQVLALHVDWDSTTSVARQRGSIVGGLAYGGEAMGFTRGRILRVKGLAVMVMAVDDEPPKWKALLRGLQRA